MKEIDSYNLLNTSSFLFRRNFGKKGANAWRRGEVVPDFLGLRFVWFQSCALGLAYYQGGCCDLKIRNIALNLQGNILFFTCILRLHFAIAHCILRK